MAEPGGTPGTTPADAPTAETVKQAMFDLYNAVGHNLDGSPVWSVLDFAYGVVTGQTGGVVAAAPTPEEEP